MLKKAELNIIASILKQRIYITPLMVMVIGEKSLHRKGITA
jgi:hypothetical protein